MSLTDQDMKAIKSVVKEVINEEVTPQFRRLEKKVDRNHAMNLQYHLETRNLISDQAQKNDRFRENLTQAVSSL